MAFGLIVFYRVLGAVLLALAAAALWEKYRLVHGASLLPARVLACRKNAHVNPRSHAGGWCYTVELYVDGEHLESETNDSFWFEHKAQIGRTVQVYYKRGERYVERKSPETEIFSAFLVVVGLVLLLIR